MPKIAPDAPHALHMPSHIFTRVGAWADSVATNRALGRRREEEQRTGRGAARAGLHDLCLSPARAATATRARFWTRHVRSTRNQPARATASLRARGDAGAICCRAWRVARGDTAHACDRVNIRITEAMTHLARALGAARSGDPAAAQKDVERITTLRDDLKAAKNNYWANEVEVMRLVVARLDRARAEEDDEALGLMRQAADMEDKSEKNIVTPGRLLPARELLGDMLMELKRPGGGA